MQTSSDRSNFFGESSSNEWAGEFRSPMVAALFARNGPSSGLSMPPLPPLPPHQSMNSGMPTFPMSHDFGSSGGGNYTGSSNYKTRKPVFQPFFAKSVVARGLQNGELIQGVIRVNQRNFEESFIDNPDGDQFHDIMILGMHDRNRALHGDVVVVRLKERNQWVVRESLYEAWRNGHLNVPCDEDGQPLPIPPVKAEETPSTDNLLVAQAVNILPATLQPQVVGSNLNTNIPQPKNKRYNQATFLKLGVQMEMRRLKQAQQSPSDGGDATSPNAGSNDNAATTSAEIDPTIGEALSRLCINKADAQPSNTAAITDATNTNGVSPPTTSSLTSVVATANETTSTSNNRPRRTAHRQLADMSDEDWGIPDICLQKTAEVVYIAEAKNCRTAVGQLKVMADSNTKWGLFSPTDPRMPRMVIPADEMPPGFFERPQDFNKYLFIANLIEWQATAQFARGKLYKSLGMVGDIDAETEGLLMSNDVDTRAFSPLALNSLPIVEGVPWTIDEKEFKYRRDYRKETIFTIDPSTARDLDDALHIKRIADCDGRGTPGWEVGVHIADVAHFVLPHTELDSWAEHRATSVYLVHKVIPMLPRILCEELCSLNSGVDRLCFSVVWKMDENAQIKDQWFGRTIIHSCVKLAYEHAQDMIEHPDKEFKASELPAVVNEKSIAQIKESVLNLNMVARILKKLRLELGSLRLDQNKLKFVLSPETGLPLAVGNEERKDANFLVEEFMLLANQCVAKHIYDKFPEHSLLRRHPAPKAKVLRDMEEKCEYLNYPVNFGDGATIADSLKEYMQNEATRLTVYPVLVQYMMRCMQLAVYFCSSTQNSFHHYALNVPFYTHFTSPIRRYPDVVVHRLLAASLGYSPPPEYAPLQLQKVCDNCNERKVNAKTVSDQSAEMFFGLFVREMKRLDTLGIVVGVLDAAFDVLIVKYNIIRRCYVPRLKLAREPRFIDGIAGVLVLHWDPAYALEASRRRRSSKKVAEAAMSALSGHEMPKEDVEEDEDSALEQQLRNLGNSNVVLEQTLKVFSPVRVVLTPNPEPLKFQVTIEPSPDKFPLTNKEITKLVA